MGVGERWPLPVMECRAGRGGALQTGTQLAAASGPSSHAAATACTCVRPADYGPPGCAMKQNVTQEWRNHFVLEENMLEVGSRCSAWRAPAGSACVKAGSRCGIAVGGDVALCLRRSSGARARR